ncbi:hypothetical protein CJ178_27975 [Rhodococcus sp. ACPA4]|nr:hypothetical protein CJ178_27975 [Rhodococcus sp. ACPA4]
MADGPRIYSDAASMASAQVINAALGMGFWAIAALILPPAQLGVMTALLALVTAPAMVIGTGVGDVFNSMMPAAGPELPSVFRRGLRVFYLLSVPAGIIAAGAAVVFISEVRFSIPVAAMVFAGVIVWGLFVLQNSTLTSLDEARRQPLVNGAVSLGRIAVLLLLVWLANWQPIVMATVLVGGVAVVAMRVFIGRIVSERTASARQGTWTAEAAATEVVRMCKQAVPTQAMGIGVILLMPFLVTAYAGPVQGAVFSLSMSIAQTLEFVGSAMGTSLVVHASKNPREGSKMALVLFVRVSVLVAVGGILLSLAAPVIFGILNPEYLDLNAELVVVLLALGSLLRTMFVVWSALQRARREIGPLVVINGLFAAVVMAILPFACHLWGAVGAALTVGIAQAAASIAAVFGVARRRDSIRKRVFQYEV